MTEEAEVFENERYVPFFGFGSGNLLATDPPGWSSRAGTAEGIAISAGDRFPRVQCRTGWHWQSASQWQLDQAHGGYPCDQYGWSYAADFPDESWRAEAVSGVRCVRRRRYRRVRCSTRGRMHDAEMAVMQRQVERGALERALAREMGAVAVAEEERQLMGDVKFHPLNEAAAFALSELKSAAAELRSLQRFLQSKARLDVRYARGIAAIGAGSSGSSAAQGGLAGGGIGSEGGGGGIIGGGALDKLLSSGAATFGGAAAAAATAAEEPNGAAGDRLSKTGAPSERRLHALAKHSHACLEAAGAGLGGFSEEVESSLVGTDLKQLCAVFAKYAEEFEARLQGLRARRTAAEAAVAHAFGVFQKCDRARAQPRTADSERRVTGTWGARLQYAQAREQLADADGAFATEAPQLLAKMTKLRLYRESVSRKIVEALLVEQRDVWRAMAQSLAAPAELAQRVAAHEGRTIPKGNWGQGGLDGSAGQHSITGGDLSATMQPGTADEPAKPTSAPAPAGAAFSIGEASDSDEEDASEAAPAVAEVAASDPAGAAASAKADLKDDLEEQSRREEEARQQGIVELAKQAARVSISSTEGSMQRHLRSGLVAKVGMLAFETTEISGFKQGHNWAPVLVVLSVDKWVHAFGCRTLIDFGPQTRCFFSMNVQAAKVTSPLVEGEGEGKPGREHGAVSICIEDQSSVLDKLRSASTRVLRSGVVSGLELMIDSLPKVSTRSCGRASVRAARCVVACSHC